MRSGAGTVNGGGFSNDDETWAKFNAALATSGEKFWRLPLGDEYAEQIKSDIGDIKKHRRAAWRSDYSGGVP